MNEDELFSFLQVIAEEEEESAQEGESGSITTCFTNHDASLIVNNSNLITQPSTNSVSSIPHITITNSNTTPTPLPESLSSTQKCFDTIEKLKSVGLQKLYFQTES